MNKLTPVLLLTAVGFLAGFLGTTAYQNSFSTLKDNQGVSQFDTPEYHTGTFSTPNNNSYVDFHNLEPSTQYTMGSVVNGSFRSEVTFTTNEKGNADVKYKLSDYKARGNYEKTDEGYKHILRQNGETVEDFYLTTPVWVYEKGVASYRGTTQIERDEAVMWKGARNTDSQGWIKLFNNETSDKVSSSQQINSGILMFDQDSNDLVLLDANQDEKRRWDAKNFSNAKVKITDTIISSNQKVFWKKVPRTQISSWVDWNRYEFSEPSQFDRVELFNSADSTTIEFKGESWTNSIVELRNQTSETLSIKGTSGGYHFYTYPADLTDADNDGTVEKNDECPETKGYKSNGCPYDSFVGEDGGTGGSGDNIVTTPVGQFNSNTTTGIGVGVFLGLVAGAGAMYFFS